MRIVVRLSMALEECEGHRLRWNQDTVEVRHAYHRRTLSGTQKELKESPWLMLARLKRSLNAVANLSVPFKKTPKAITKTIEAYVRREACRSS